MAADAEPPPRASAWVSQGLEVLQQELADRADPSEEATHFDVLIVGSGYGGAVAADRLAGRRGADGRPLRLAVLERGREYLRGAFPGGFGDLPGHVRFTLPGGTQARGRLEGLFDLRVGADMSVLVANGVGGGSLINAGVMLFPDDAVWADAAWPPALDAAELRERAAALQEELGTARDGRPNALDPDAPGAVPRLAAMRALGQGLTPPQRARPAPITVATTAGRVSCAGVRLEPCIGCGDCAAGCNHGAKESLDLGLLRRAQRRGARVFAGATVARLRRVADEAGGSWEVDVWHTDLALRRRMAGPLQVRAQRLILAAGALGSTELLLRSQTDDLRFSPQLGRRFSGNGDVLAALYKTDWEMNAVADETVQPSQRRVGPTITSMIDLRGTGSDPAGDCIVQDLAVPAPLQRLMEEATTTAALLQSLGEGAGGPHEAGAQGVDPLAVDSAKQRRSTVVALIARDGADGVLRAVPARPPAEGLDAGLEVDPGLRIDWPQARDDARVAAAQERLAGRLAATSQGQLLPNPVWRLAPQAMADLLGVRKGPLMTVHPLGGCAMGRTRDGGVVDDLGAVFDGDPQRPAHALHEGLHVLDGAIVPCSLGVNPALTIATLADRAVQRLRAQWGIGAEVEGEAAPAASVEERPVFAHRTDTARPAVPTEMQVVERLTGEIDIGGRACFAELSLLYEPTPLPGRDAPLDGWTLRVCEHPVLSRLRLFDAPQPPGRDRIHALEPRDRQPGAGPQLDDPSDEAALLVVPILQGSTLRVLQREPSTPLGRQWRALPAWLGNRAWRDLAQVVGDFLGGRGCQLQTKGLGGLLDRAGEVRRFDYALQLGLPLNTPRGAFAGWADLPAHQRQLHGHKRLTYARRSSPWRQLMQMELTALGPLAPRGRRRLAVEPAYFAQTQVPLLRIVRQQHLPAAYADLAAFGLYLLRILVSIHLWSFRKPDTPTGRAPQRLPGALPGLPAPEVHELHVAHANPASPAAGGRLRLTRYPCAAAGAHRPPVLMIHGYSASGTTFAHPALRPSLAEALWRDGREPWMLDLRSSAGLPTARLPWIFEDLAEGDIPLAMEFVCRATGQTRIDVVSHCMGSAMFSMAVLGPDAVAARVVPRLRRWVMSQVGPTMLFSPANLLRAYLLQYVVTLLPQIDYPIGGPAGPAGADGDIFDRLLASLPTLGEGRDSEFDVENPRWTRFWRRTPWVRTRHRLDALFGRVFDSRRMSREVLDHIDDFFGEIHLGTVSQTIHFAGWRSVASATGAPGAYLRAAHKERRLDAIDWHSLHARDSGLSSWETALLMEDLGRSERVHLVEGSGHQDLWLGRQAAQVTDKVLALLRAP